MDTGSTRYVVLTSQVTPPDALTANGPVRRRLSASTALGCALALSTVVALPACSPVPNLPPAPPEPAANAGFMTHLPPYRIQVGDVLDIRLLLNPELNEEVTVRPDGYISTTVVPDQRAYGMTVPQLDAALQHDYGVQLRNPRVNVVVKSFAPTRVYVGGQVANPGEFITVGPNLTLSQAIARAGGLKPLTGDENKIFIIRRGVNDVPEFLSVRYNAIMWGKDPSADVRLAPYDVVYVPRSGAAEVYRWFERILPAIRTGELGILLCRQSQRGSDSAAATNTCLASSGFRLTQACSIAETSMVYQRSFREILHVFLRRKTLFAVVFGAVGLAGGAYLLLKQPLYMSNASLVLHFGNQTVPDIDRSERPTQLEGSNEHREILYSDAAILNSPDVIRRVIDTVGLARLYPDIAKGDATPARKEALAQRAFDANLTVDVGLQSDVINVNFLSPNAVLSHDAMQELLNVFYEQEADVYANPQLKFAESEAKHARASLTQAQNDLASFKSGHEISNLSEQVSQLLQQRTDVESRLRVAQGTVLQAQQQEDALTALLKTIPATVTSSAAGEEYQAADSAESRLDQLRAKRSQLASTYRSDSPVFRELDAQIASLSKASRLRNSQSRGRTGYAPNAVYQSIRTDYLRAAAQATSAKQPVEVLQSQLKQINGKLNDLEAQQNQYDNLTQAVQIHSDTYRSLAIRYQTARVEANRNAQRISAAVLIAAPIVPTQPARPRKKLVALGTLLMALILATGTVLAIEAFDDRFRTPADVTRVLRLPVLATFAGDAD